MIAFNEYETLDKFKIDKTNGKINEDELYFIKDNKIIYTRGVFYGQTATNSVNLNMNINISDGEYDAKDIEQDVQTILGGNTIEELCNMILNGSINVFIDKNNTHKLKIYQCSNTSSYCCIIYGYEIINIDNFWFNQSSVDDNFYPTPLSIGDGEIICIYYNKSTDKYIIKYAAP